MDQASRRISVQRKCSFQNQLLFNMSVLFSGAKHPQKNADGHISYVVHANIGASLQRCSYCHYFGGL
jgi:hypothetical protein